MRKFTKSKVFVAAIVGGILGTHTALAEVDIEGSFHPYADGLPTAEGVTPGMVIDSSNVDQVKHALDEQTYGFVKAGDYQITVAPTIDFNLNAKYIEASKQNGDVGFDENGNLTNYVSGRPFPYPPKEEDPQAGVKLIWNFQYGTAWGDLGCLSPFYYLFKDMRSGNLERTIQLDKLCFQRKARRTMFEPKPEVTPNPDGIFRAMYLRVSEPFDLKDTQLLIHKYKDDAKRTNAWMYLGFQRRVRRLSTGQTTDSYLGTDLMIEDFEGYNGQVTDFNWEYLGTKTLLMPMWAYDSIPEEDLSDEFEHNGFKYVDFGGKAKCFPKAPWMLRKVYLLKGSPKDSSHPISHRIHYVDAQSNDLPMNHIYDRKGEFWKWFAIGYSHADHHLPINKGAGVIFADAAAMIDVQVQHCTSLHFYSTMGADLTDESTFQVQNLRASAN